MPSPCPKCGFESPDGFAYCGRCGTRLAAAAPAEGERDATIQQLKEAGDAAKRSADPAAALEHYQKALTLLDSAILASDATLHVQLLKTRFDILAERVPLWAASGRPDRVEPDLKEMLAIARRAGDGARLAQAITALARHYLAGRLDELARPLLEEAVSLLRSQNDRAGEAAALADLAYLNWRAGRLDTVADAFQRAHELRRHVADPAGLARSYFDLGLLYRDGLSHPFHAVNHFEKSIELARQAGDIGLETRGWIELGVSRTRLGDYPHAQAVLEQAQHRQPDAGSSEGLAWLLVAQADLLRETGSPDAHTVIERAIGQAIELDLADLEWSALLGRARVEQAAGAWEAARAPIDRMQALEHDGGLFAYCAIWSSALLARTCAHTGQPDLAATVSAGAVNALQAHGFTGVPAPQAILWAHFEALNAKNDPSAFHFLRQARELMLAQANTIGDGGLRARFLRDVSINRAIGDDWARQHA